MAESSGRWVTINGAHVFIEKGQSVNEALDGLSKGKRGKKRISDGKHEYSVDEGKSWFEMGADAYGEYDADPDDFDRNTDDDFEVEEERIERIAADINEYVDKGKIERYASDFAVDEDELTNKTAKYIARGYDSDDALEEAANEIFEEELEKDRERGEKYAVSETLNGVTTKAKPYIQYPDGVIKGPEGFLEEEEWAKVQKENPDAIRKATQSEEDEYWAETESRKEKEEALESEESQAGKKPEGNRGNIEDYFSEGDISKIEGYADLYGIDREEAKRRIYDAFNENIESGSSYSNAINDALENVLGEYELDYYRGKTGDNKYFKDTLEKLKKSGANINDEKEIQKKLGEYAWNRNEQKQFIDWMKKTNGTNGSRPASNPSSDAKRKVEGMLGREFSEEEWNRIVELAKSIK